MHIVDILFLDEFELVVSTDDDYFNQAVKPTMIMFPNPLGKNNSLIFLFEGVKTTQEIKLKIYNVKGQLVQVLSDASQGPKNQIEWDGTTANGKNVGSGIYFVRAEFLDHDGHRCSLYEKFVVLK